ncbi:PIR protein [Plasmodium yoelii]|uniref:PIR protein n=2 Tax=Plasmodium yoelii TaxID=5861 RepID=A0AAE9WST8_PLAYO|nr:PIR protein [Plasmodium yoelii]WBY55823.1 PIR protein [Plasmodium yoelii yoelii]CDS44090.1 YIR protein [Plasmodium yoelii]VTZ74566.1 PIR protein [Plasmodium yoelii]|eukprot:XP_022811135.1 PIR protein [Plasmodium yoelii]
MNKEVCEKFKNIWDAFPDTLDNSKNYQFNDFVLLNNKCNKDNFSNNYCNNIDFSNSFCDINKFQSDFNRISAGFLYLLDEFIKDCGVAPSPAKYNINIVDYILIWLSYMLNLKISEEENIITCFYSEYIFNCGKYKTQINELTDYDSYKELIDKKLDVLNMDSNNVSKFYKVFKSLCEMYNELDDDKTKCKKYLEDDNEFDQKYKELKNDSDIADKSPYKEILSTLSTDYENFKKECNDTSSSTSEETLKNPEQRSVEGYKQLFGGDFGGDFEEIFGQGSEPSSEVIPSSLSITNKLIPVLLIFGAIPIFFGISYKYSLFGFRKRFQKLREKLKK